MSGRHDFEQLAGMSAKMVEILKRVEVCAENDHGTVLITGEPGTGKEVIARSIHTCGLNHRAPFIQFNCAAMSDCALEQEMFGDHDCGVAGISRLENGHPAGGTLFVEDIDSLSLSFQQELYWELRIYLLQWQAGDFSTRVPLRVIAATSRNLQQLVEQSLFHAQLYSLLSMTTIPLPPLRERRECLPALTDHFIGYFNLQYGKKIRGVRLATMTFLQHYHWPGNVRELRNAIGAAVQNETSPFLTPGSLPAEICCESSVLKGESCYPAEIGETAADLPLDMLPLGGITLEQVEKKLIKQALQRFSGNQSKAARCLGMSRDTIRYRIKKFGLD